MELRGARDLLLPASVLATEGEGDGARVLEAWVSERERLISRGQGRIDGGHVPEAREPEWEPRERERLTSILLGSGARGWRLRLQWSSRTFAGPESYEKISMKKDARIHIPSQDFAIGIHCPLEVRESSRTAHL